MALVKRGELVMGTDTVTTGVDNWTIIGVYIAWGSCAHKFLSKSNHVESSILKT